MAITTKYCQKELEEYGGCVVSHPASWQEKCLDLKLKVAQCTSSQYVQMSLLADKCIYISLLCKAIYSYLCHKLM